MDIHEIVTRLIGPIEPAGDSTLDGKRFENLKVMTELIDALVQDIHYVEMDKNSHQDSVSKAGKFASKFLRSDLGMAE